MPTEAPKASGSTSNSSLPSRRLPRWAPDRSQIPTPFETHKIEPPSQEVTTTKAELMYFFENMYRMRRMEIAADMAYKAKFIRGFCHLWVLPPRPYPLPDTAAVLLGPLLFARWC